MTYGDFLAAKAIVDCPTGLPEIQPLTTALFDFQRDIVAWALRRGRAAIFADCGLGKTPMQLEWARHIPGRVLILAPLAVSAQTVREATKFGIDGVAACRRDDGARIAVTNYEMMHHFDAADFAGVVLDESSILKSYDGAFRSAVIEKFSKTPFRLACTATPAPNDHAELANHAEFLGVMSRIEMLATFFVHDGGETSIWRLKRHGQSDFWRWMCSWATLLRKPSDLGYEDDGFVLPALRIHHTIVESPTAEGLLFPVEALSLQERLAARRASIDSRVAAAAAIANAARGQVLVWCNLNAESEALAAAIDGAVEVRGSDSPEHKETAMLRFSAGDIRALVTKPSIAGFGMNWQQCSTVAFVGLSDSYEQYYQAVRRCWRFGQANPVDVHVVTAEAEGAVVANIERKERDAERMASNMVEHMKDLNRAAIHGAEPVRKDEYRTALASGADWDCRLGDAVEEVACMDTGSVHYTIYSPPFASLYTYSASDRDMGNCRDVGEFLEHYKFLVRELLRVTMPGRLLSFHCMNLPISKEREGFIGLRDFRGDLIRVHLEAGWIYHSEVCIWKDPVTAMQRTKALGLLHKQIKKDSCMSRQGIADYLVTMRAPGENPERVAHSGEQFPVQLWQQYASPVWMDINPSDTLQRKSAKEAMDERHIAPLQLEVIRRAIFLWSAVGDLVLSPFAGIGSEGVVAVGMGRRFLGIELKASYWKQACANLANAQRSGGLFDSEVNT